MNRCVYFVTVLLAYAALMLVTMAPHVDTSHCDQFEGVPQRACIEAAESGPPPGGDTHPCSALTGDDLIKCTEENPTHTGTHAGMAPGTVALTIGDPLCVVAPALRDPGCPNAMPGAAPMAPPTTGGMPPMEPMCFDPARGQIPCSQMPGASDPGHHPPPSSMPPMGDHSGMQGQHDGPPIDPRSGQPFTKADEDKYQKYGDECEATKGLLSEGSMQELVADGFTRLQVEKLCKDGPADHRDGPPGMPPQ